MRCRVRTSDCEERDTPEMKQRDTHKTHANEAPSYGAKVTADGRSDGYGWRGQHLALRHVLGNPAHEDAARRELHAPLSWSSHDAVIRTSPRVRGGERAAEIRAAEWRSEVRAARESATSTAESAVHSSDAEISGEAAVVEFAVAAVVVGLCDEEFHSLEFLLRAAETIGEALLCGKGDVADSASARTCDKKVFRILGLKSGILQASIIRQALSPSTEP
jgi:hypothetical protein